MIKFRRSSKKLLTATFDRGPARYFHGRKQVLNNFHELVSSSVQAEGGTIFLIQGAPGVGKSALLHECERLARERGWKTVEIDAPALWDTDSLRDFLGRGFFSGIASLALKIGWRKIVDAEVRVESVSRTIRKLLQKGKQPLLLILDEAQTLGITNKPPKELEGATTNVLNHIHNGKLGRPVIFLVAGLKGTKDAFAKLGISRFSANCIVELGALGREPERAIIQDWLTKEGRAKGNTTEWIDTIAQETHGWPQHIQVYVRPAAKQLKSNNGILTTEGLNVVLEEGRKECKVYYSQRLDDFRGDQIRCLARSIPEKPQERSVKYEDVISSLTEQYGKGEAEELFDRLIKKGILEESERGYAIPIPSMHTWLRDTYSHG
ncbi:MAG: ATP-binding protein [Bacteroidetes bacterium]|nr:ATP-binding protein [Bacteroidota bacterium]MCY4204866.1 ATP-binding protein [Bacteroidota bacterium]